MTLSIHKVGLVGLIGCFSLTVAWSNDQTNPSLNKSAWTNSLGMVFRPVAGCEAWFSIWETRVKDFRAFVSESRYKVEDIEVFPRSGNRSTKEKRNWLTPGFVQTEEHPVVLVSWEDAQAFCKWLTQRDQSRGLIGSNSYYRLPTDKEWTCAAGPGRYPWLLPSKKSSPASSRSDEKETQDDERLHFPPPPQAGNYAGTELPMGIWPPVRLKNYRDKAIYTAASGQFNPNFYGLFDIGGNVAEWCEDWFRQEMNSPEIASKLPFHNNDGGGRTFRVVRGGSWSDSHPGLLLTGCRSFDFPDHRADNLGFRVLLNR